MNIQETLIPDVTPENIETNKVMIANNIISSYLP